MGKAGPLKSTIARQSAEALRDLKSYLQARQASSPCARLRLLSETESGDLLIAVPVEALALLAEVLEQLAQGRGVRVSPESAELTSREVAGVLNVSVSYLEKLLDDGKLPYHEVGAERRVWLNDLLAYKQRDLTRRRRIAAKLTAESQAMGLYD